MNSDIVFVTAPEGLTLTPENCTPLEPGDDSGRGSFVFFNEASMYMSSETNHPTLAQAKLAGHSGTVDFKKSAQELFTQYTRASFAA
jgi:hypothetical protein